MEYEISKVLVTEAELRAKVAELGARITADYADKKPIMVCVLKGATIFFADLIRAINLDIRIDFLIVSSYGDGMESSGRVKLVKDIDSSIDGADVIIVEDIVDSGNTLSFIKKLFSLRKAKSVALCSLFDKPSRRTTELVSDYVGFVIPDEFIVGYGLDSNEIYRNLPHVCVLSPLSK